VRKSAKLDAQPKRVDDVRMQSFSIAYDHADLTAMLAAVCERQITSHPEVETHTWDVLPAEWRTGSKAADIAREIAFRKRQLAR
jgi:hypothetical protein